MRRIKCLTLFLVILITLLPINALATGNWYYGSGNYVTSAPIKPTNLSFYVHYSAISAYGSSPFSVAFDWNGSYEGQVSAVAQYPASESSYPDYFTINTASMSPYTQGETFYFTSSGTQINDTFPMDSSSIYKCRISLNSNSSAFNVGGSFSSAYLAKVIRHEIGHVFLLKHPSNLYFSSVMHQGAPNGSTISETITSDDRDNIITKWGT